MDLNGRVIAITGASRGLGAGMATWFAAQGASLALCARTEPVAPDGVECVTGAVDVTDPEAVARFARHAAQTISVADVWINNAGVLEPVVSQRQLSAAALAEHFAINVGGVLNGTQAYLHTLDEQDRTGVLRTSAPQKHEQQRSPTSEDPRPCSWPSLAHPSGSPSKAVEANDSASEFGGLGWDPTPSSSRSPSRTPAPAKPSWRQPS